MSLPELDLKKDEKSKLILSVAQKLKLAKKPWDDFAKIYHKYSQALLAVTAIGKQVTEQLNTIGALHKGDVGENITRLSGVQAAIDQKLEAISNCIEIELVTPIQNSLAPDQQSVGNFEKEFVKNSENIGSQLKKIEAQTKKVGKKGNNDDLMTVMSQFKNKITELDNWKSDSLKRVFLLERKRFCELLSHCCKVSQAELDLAQTISTYDTLLPQWNATVATAEVLPDELLKKFTTQGGLMQLTTAESASVQLANTTDQRIQNMHRVNEFAPPSDLPPPPPGSSGGYDSYEQPSYDNGDYSNNGYSNDYSSTDYGGYDAPDDVPPPPMSTPPPPPMSNPPPPPVKKMNGGPPSGPPSFTPRTPRDTMPPNSMPPPPPVKKMGGPPPGPPSFTPPPPMTTPAPPKITPRASQQMSPSPPKYAPPPPNVKAAAPPPPMNTPPPPPMSRTPPMPPKNAGGPPTPPSMPKSMSGSGGAPPPPPAPKAPGPPPPPPVSSSSKKSKAKDDDDDDHHHSGGGERNALLSSIHSFKKGGLKKAVTNDRSGPNLTQPKGGAGGSTGRGMPMMM